MVKSWKRIEPTEVRKVGYRTIVTKHFVLPNGKTYEYQTVYAEGQICAGCIAVTPDHKVVAAAQFRAGPEQIMYDAPGGFCDEDEEPLDAMKRELLEETGYESDEWIHVGVSHKDAYNNGTWHYFVALNARPSAKKAKGDDNEFIEPVLLDINTFLDHAKNGRVSDPDAVLMAYDKLLELK